MTIPLSLNHTQNPVQYPVSNALIKGKNWEAAVGYPRSNRVPHL